MRTAISWLIGIAVMLLVGVCLTALGEALGVPSSIDLDGPATITHGSGRYSYDEEATALQTSYGYASGTLAVLAALWAGQAVYCGSLGAGFSRRGWYSYLAWVMATIIFMALSLLIHLAFRQFHSAIAGYVRMLLELACLVGVAWATHQWYKNRVAQFSKHD